MNAAQHVPNLLIIAIIVLAAASPAAAQQPPDQSTAGQAAAQTVPAVTLPQAGPGDYVVGTQDVLNIKLFEQPSADGKYTVAIDGTFDFPLIGKVTAAGLTLRQVEADMRVRLAAGYFKDPHVAVTIDQFRGRRVFVFGGGVSPGTYPLGDNASLLEILAKAGYPGNSEVIVVRVSGATGPIMPADAEPGEVIRVNLREFEKDVEEGVLSRNILLQDGDTIFVPRVDRNRVYISGEIKTPGAYSLPEGTTVLQFLSLAGGVTEGASTGKIKILRLVDGKRKTIKVKLDDVVLPGDTVIVPTRIF